jgi:hypothetical protein
MNDSILYNAWHSMLAILRGVPEAYRSNVILMLNETYDKNGKLVVPTPQSEAILKCNLCPGRPKECSGCLMEQYRDSVTIE